MYIRRGPPAPGPWLTTVTGTMESKAADEGVSLISYYPSFNVRLEGELPKEQDSKLRKGGKEGSKIKFHPTQSKHLGWEKGLY